MTVALHRFRTELERFRDLSGSIAAGDQSHHFDLTMVSRREVSRASTAARIACGSGEIQLETKPPRLLERTTLSLLRAASRRR
jgi:hypothetical protein